MEQFERLRILIGDKNILKLKKIKVVVLGLGGVGGYVVESLVRSGVGSIVIVDYDKVDITNLNRQIISNLDNIGKYKTDLFLERIKKINKDCKVEVINLKIDSSNVYMLFDDVSYVIDCCDDVSCKEEVILKCLEKKIKFYTCMGMGNRLDPSMLEICDIRKTSYDPLAKKIRKWVSDNHIKGKILCCYSKEKPIKTSKKVIGSAVFVPASAGILLASKVINDVINEKK